MKAKTKKFDDMTPAQKRMAIAQDVIAQLAAKQLIAKSGIYCSMPANAKVKDAKCTVCGIGAIFVAKCRRTDPSLTGKSIIRSWEDDYYDDGELTIEKVQFNSADAEDIHILMKGIFSVDQLELIEAAFEGYADGDTFFSDVDLDPYSDADLRLRLIMENIIVNKGTFIPSPAHKNHFDSDFVYVTPGLSA